MASEPIKFLQKSKASVIPIRHKRYLSYDASDNHDQNRQLLLKQRDADFDNTPDLVADGFNKLQREVTILFLLTSSNPTFFTAFSTVTVV
jgi:hypothetical protein